MKTAESFFISPNLNPSSLILMEKSVDVELNEGGIQSNKPLVELEKTEKAWRHIKKPFLRIGSKGAKLSHGSSLKELLYDHTAVKVKINTNKMGTLEEAFEILKKLTEDSGGESRIELIKVRTSQNIIMLGRPGTRDMIAAGEYPPPPPPPLSDEEENNALKV